MMTTIIDPETNFSYTETNFKSEVVVQVIDTPKHRRYGALFTIPFDKRRVTVMPVEPKGKGFVLLQVVKGHPTETAIHCASHWFDTTAKEVKAR